MLPGLGRGMNPHKMKRMMKQMGINIEEITDIDTIIIRTSDKEYIFNSDVAVTVMTAQGQKTFQIIGEPRVQDRSESGSEAIPDQDRSESGSEAIPDEVEAVEEEEETISIPQDDIDLVCAQTGVGEEEAKAALEACNGNPALKLF
jgi:nascent polypeptide-associated complex subunit alpha